MNTRHIALISIVFVLTVALVSCYSTNSKGLEGIIDRPTPIPLIMHPRQPRPDFVLSVSPEEQQILSPSVFEADWTEEYHEETGIWIQHPWGILTTGYKNTICIDIELGYLAQIGDDFTRQDSITERVEMEVDGVSLSEIRAGHTYLTATHVYNAEGETLILGTGAAVACGEAQLSPGVHEVTFRFHRTSGDVEEYRWPFALIKGS